MKKKTFRNIHDKEQTTKGNFKEKNITAYIREEVAVDKAGGLGSPMTVVNTNIRRRRGRKNLALIFKVGIRLHHRH